MSHLSALSVGRGARKQHRKSQWQCVCGAAEGFRDQGSAHFAFFFNDTATTEIYTLSLHDALPILPLRTMARTGPSTTAYMNCSARKDRKSTRLNSSHDQISYAVFCLKKKKKK